MIKTCLQCGTEFTTDRNAAKYCCIGCSSKSHKKPRNSGDALARLMTKYVVDENGCWIYQGFLSHRGYGNFWWNGRTVPAHRAMFMLVTGELTLSPGVLVCHTCDVRPCINPDHLFKGTPRDNMLDMVAKGRKYDGPRKTPVGEIAYRRKLTVEQVRRIKQLLLANVSPTHIARTYNVTPGAIRSILRGASYAWVEA